MSKTIAERTLVAPGTGADLDAIDPRETFETERNDAEKALRRDGKRIVELSSRLYAERRRSLLVVLQGPDAAGKDGATRHVFSGVNPQHVVVHAFGAPTSIELARDYLWRIHLRCPPRGTMAVFNRSHYEDVVIVRVNKLVPDDVWRRRYDHINAFERMLADEGTTILKFYLHISREEQRERLLRRIHDPQRNWKFSGDDFEKRLRWDDFRAAYEAVLTRCSTEHAPWRVIPADRKWFRNHAIARIVADTLEEMDPKYPRLSLSEEEMERLVREA